MKLITQASGVGLFEDGSRLLVVNRGTSGFYYVRFILALLTLILGANGLGLLFRALSESTESATTGLVLIGIAVGTGIGMRAVNWLIKDYHREMPTVQDAALIFDLENQTLLDDAQTVVAPLNEVTLVRRFQLRSRFRKLVAETDGGRSFLVLRINPVARGIGTIEKEIRQRTSIS